MIADLVFIVALVPPLFVMAVCIAGAWEYRNDR